MKKILVVGWLALVSACGGEEFTVGDGGAIVDRPLLSGEGGAPDDPHDATPSVDPDAGAGAQDAGTDHDEVLVEAGGEDHSVKTPDAGDVVDAGRPAAVCCFIGSGTYEPASATFYPCGGGDAQACILGNGCLYQEGMTFVHGTFVVCP